MMTDTAQALIDLTASVSHDPDEEDWYDVDELAEMLQDPLSVLKEILHFIHEEYL